MNKKRLLDMTTSTAVLRQAKQTAYNIIGSL